VAKTSWTSVGVPVALAVSMGLNITALLVPFLSFTILGKTETYSVPHTVQKLWNSNLKWLAALITAFSICFPLFKLVSLSIIWFVQPFSAKWRESYLNVMT
jgi:uncharacterized paraquat-inducible protein A